MALAFAITAAVMTGLFLFAGIYVLREARRISEPRFARLIHAIALASLIMSMVGAFFILMGIAHIDLKATDSIAISMIFGFVVMLASFWLAYMSVKVALELAEPMRKAERMMNALSNQIPETSVADLGLTTRELEVVSVIAEGSITDAQIADMLFISKATAATHVRNILKKADLRNRRDLMLLSGWQEIDPSYRSVRPRG